jgi:hypothetical protein
LSLQPPFKIGSAFALAFRLIGQNWRKLLWLYIVLMMVPHTLMGELADQPGELLFGFFNGQSGDGAGALPNITGYLWDIPTALFYAAALATMLRPDMPPWHGTARALPTTLLALVVPSVLIALLTALPGLLVTDGASLSTSLFWALQILTYLYYFMYAAVAILLFVSCAAATTRFNVLHAIRRSFHLVKPFWFRIMVLAFFIGLCEVASRLGEQMLLRSFDTPDATVVDWATTVIQETLRSGYRVLAAALEVAAFVLLVTYHEGPPPAETAAVFD